MKVRTRARLLTNAFCPTGKGGGVDPSCSSRGRLGSASSASLRAEAASQVAGIADHPTVRALVSSRERLKAILESEEGTKRDRLERYKTEKEGIFNDARTAVSSSFQVASDEVARDTGLPPNEVTKKLDRVASLVARDIARPDAEMVSAIRDSDRFLHPLTAASILYSVHESMSNVGLFYDKSGAIRHDSVAAVERAVLGKNVSREVREDLDRVGTGGLPSSFAGVASVVLNRRKSSRPVPAALVDPTRTATMRRAFAAVLSRQFARLRFDLYELVVTQDAFGIGADQMVGNAFCPTGPGGGVDPTCSPGIQSASFKAWFGKSKVVDSEGQPLVVYHGATQQFDAFNPGSIFFTDNPDVAHSFAKSRAEFAGEDNPTPRLISAYMSIKKPFVIDAKGQAAGNIQFSPGDRTGYRAAMASDKYDGVIIKNTSDEGNLYVAKKPEQVKSTDNRGTFDPKDASVYNTRWRFASDPEKVAAFTDWLRGQLKARLRGRTEDEIWRLYIEQGFKKGAGRAFDDATKKDKAAGHTLPNKLGGLDAQSAESFYQGGKARFLQSAFSRPVALEKVKLLVGRVYTDLDGVTEDAATKMTRVLVDGLIQGKSPRVVAADLAKVTDLSKARALTIARTELIRAHAEGQLTALEDLGVEEVGAQVEWSTTGDAKVCPACRPLQGVVFKIAEARGILPRHPNCRCAWIPAGLGEPTKGQKRRQAKAGAIRRSIKAGGPLKNVSHDPNPAVREFSRLYSTNSFCPTGKGGGIDPTCSPGKPSHPKMNEPQSAKSAIKIAKRVIGTELGDLLSKNGIRVVISDREDVKNRGGAAYLKYQGTVAVAEGSKPITVVHEFGHAVDASLASNTPVNRRKFDEHKYWSDTALTKSLAADRKAGMPKEVGPSWENPVKSWDYAFSSPQEAFAHIFAALNGDDTKSNGFSIQDAMPRTYEKVKEKLSNHLTTNEGEDEEDPSTNSFCPTGKGGGIDPTCSPGDKSSAPTQPIPDLPKYSAAGFAQVASPPTRAAEKAAAESLERVKETERDVRKYNKDVPYKVALERHAEALETYRKAAKKAGEEARLDLRSVLMGGGGGKVSAAEAEGTRWTAEEDAKRETVHTFLRDVLGKEHGELKGVTYARPEGGGTRACYQDYGHWERGEIYVNRAADAGTYAHELGHHLEEHIPGAKERTAAFLRKRCGDEIPTDLNTRFGSRFDHGERGRSDDFKKLFPDDEGSAYYVGKTYGSGRTEVLSMGLELLFRDPKHFARTDPEYFDLMISILQPSRAKI